MDNNGFNCWQRVSGKGAHASPDSQGFRKTHSLDSMPEEERRWRARPVPKRSPNAPRRSGNPQYQRSRRQRKEGGNNKNQKKKFRWHDGNGRQLTAGGILPYDDTGIWVIGEKKKNGDVEWTDPGGKYKFEDCDIYTTCAREFGEELYHSSSISREGVLAIAATHKPVYVNGHRNRPVYICYAVHTNTLRKYGVELSPTKFLTNRRRTITNNPDVPEGYYNSVVLRHVDYGDLIGPMQRSPRGEAPPVDPESALDLSYRLKRILRYGPLADRVCLDRSPTPESASSGTPPPEWDSDGEETESDELRVSGEARLPSPEGDVPEAPPVPVDISGTSPVCPIEILGTSPLSASDLYTQQLCERMTMVIVGH